MSERVSEFIYVCVCVCECVTVWGVCVARSSRVGRSSGEIPFLLYFISVFYFCILCLYFIFVGFCYFFFLFHVCILFLYFMFVGIPTFDFLF